MVAERPFKNGMKTKNLWPPGAGLILLRLMNRDVKRAGRGNLETDARE
jgi:hypothetical protein